MPKMSVARNGRGFCGFEEAFVGLVTLWFWIWGFVFQAGPRTMGFDSGAWPDPEGIPMREMFHFDRRRSGYIHEMMPPDKLMVKVIALVILVAAFAVGCARESQPVTSADLAQVTNIISQVTNERILDVRVVRGSVIVDTGRDHVVDHYFHLERTRDGWKITDKGT
jgi:hypothetical protein